ncbi:MAG: hypothetical protein ACR65R_16310 [Methylomicrobium sp.]
MRLRFETEGVDKDAIESGDKPEFSQVKEGNQFLWPAKAMAASKKPNLSVLEEFRRHFLPK